MRVTGIRRSAITGRYLVPPRGPAGDSGAQPVYRFDLTIWSETVTDSDWESYGLHANSWNGGGRYKSHSVQATDKVAFIITAHTEDEAVRKASEALNLAASESETTGFDRQKVTITIHHVINGVREVER